MTVFVTSDTSRVVVPWREDLANLIPHGRDLMFKGERMLVIPNGHDEAKICRNLQVPVPAPILTRYDWCGTSPWEIQRTTAALLTESARAYVLSTMGTGKTRAALFAADYLLRAKAVKRVLITAPLSTLTPVWEAELFRVMPGRRVKVIYGDRAKRVKLLNEDADFYIINHHGLIMLSKELRMRGFDVVIFDELAVFRNKGTDLWKAADAIVGAGVPYAWGLTGSPTPNSPTDAWAQVRLLTPTRTTRTLGQFKDQTMRQITQFKWSARTGANEAVHQAMQPAVRYTRDDVMELPETSYVDREVKLEPDAAKAYKMLFDKMRTMSSTGDSITAVNEGVLQGKLLQVACGFLYTDKKTVYALPSDRRLEALEEVVNETDRKVIVFVPYIHALDGISKYLRGKKHNVAVVSGATPRAARDSIFTKFQDPEASPRIIVAHPGCMSHGLTLTEANTIVWYSPTRRLDEYEQANARITRPGQVAKTFIVHLYGTPVERVTYARLKSKAKMQGMLLQMFKDQEVTF